MRSEGHEARIEALLSAVEESRMGGATREIAALGRTYDDRTAKGVGRALTRAACTGDTEMTRMLATSLNSGSRNEALKQHEFDEAGAKAINEGHVHAVVALLYARPLSSDGLVLWKTADGRNGDSAKKARIRAAALRAIASAIDSEPGDETFPPLGAAIAKAHGPIATAWMDRGHVVDNRYAYAIARSDVATLTAIDGHRGCRIDWRQLPGESLDGESWLEHVYRVCTSLETIRWLIAKAEPIERGVALHATKSWIAMQHTRNPTAAAIADTVHETTMPDE